MTRGRGVFKAYGRWWTIAARGWGGPVTAIGILKGNENYGMASVVMEI